MDGIALGIRIGMREINSLNPPTNSISRSRNEQQSLI